MTDDKYRGDDRPHEDDDFIPLPDIECGGWEFWLMVTIISLALGALGNFLMDSFRG